MAGSGARQEDERDHRAQRLVAGAGAALGATVLFAPAANAATFTVNTLVDSDDGDCYDGDCSLREAVGEANADAAADSVNFASGLSGTIRLTTGDDINIEAATTITGPGADVLAVSGLQEDRIFYVDPDDVGEPNAPVTISGLTLRNGRAPSDGGALYVDAAALTLDGMVFENNVASDSGGAFYQEGGTLTLTNSVFRNNHAGNDGGALYLSGTQGTPADDVEALIRNTSFTDNGSGGGAGGVYLDVSGDAVIENVTITGNEASENGGGLLVNTIDGDGDLTIRNSTIANNHGDNGGGAWIEDVEGNILIENTTISGNEANYDGGGIYFDYLYDDESTTIHNSTITGNRAALDPSGGGDYGGGGVYLYDDSEDVTDPVVENGPVSISSTIIANNSADFGPDLGQGDLADGFNVGFSLIENPAGAAVSATGPNLTAVDPQLGPLADNGDPTPTHAPAMGSPTLDNGASNSLATDQRGAPRTFDAANVPNGAGDGTDIGAVELLPGGRLALVQCKGAAENVLFAPGAPIVGTDAGDVIVGTDAADRIKSGGGNDRICADDGNDKVKSGGGKDNVSGQAGNDKLSGQAGKDKLSGNAGKDTLKGGGGADKLKGGGGKDKLRGGPGTDKLAGGGGKDDEVQ